MFLVLSNALSSTYPGKICLDQDQYIYLSHTSSEDVLKTSSRRFGEDQYTRLGSNSSRSLQYVILTLSWQEPRLLQNVFQMSSRGFPKTTSRRPEFQKFLEFLRFQFFTLLHLQSLLTEACLEPGRTSTMEIFYENT